MPKHLVSKTNSTKYVIAAFCGASVSASTFASPTGQKQWTDDVDIFFTSSDWCRDCEQRYLTHKTRGGV